MIYVCLVVVGAVVYLPSLWLAFVIGFNFGTWDARVHPAFPRKVGNYGSGTAYTYGPRGRPRAANGQAYTNVKYETLA